MPSLSISRVVPSQSVFSPVKSSSAHVLGRTLLEIRPESNVEYAYTGNSEIVFPISAPSQFIDFQNSYLRMELKVEGKNNALNFVSKYLSEGGGHSLFRTIVVESAAGVLIQRMDNYNRFYAIMSNLTHYPDYVNDVLWREGDSTLPAIQECPDRGSSSLLQGDTADMTVAYTDATQTVTIGGAALVDLTKQLNVGDYVRFTSVTGQAVSGVVLTIPTALTLTLDPSSIRGSNVGDIGAAIGSFEYWSEQGFRQTAANNDWIKLSLQLQIPVLNNGSWFPAMLSRGGIRLRLTLDSPEYVIVAGGRPITAGFTGFSYTIRNPTFCADVITGDQTLNDLYLNAWKTTGIQYSFLAYRKNLFTETTCAAGQVTYQIHPAVRSAKMLLLQMQDLRANTITGANVNAGKSSYTCDCIAQGLDMNIYELQVSIGSSRFPQSRPLQLENSLNGELEMEGERALNQAGGMVYCRRAKPELVSGRKNGAQRRVPYNYEHNGTGGAIRLFPAIELARHSSCFSGIDCSINPVAVELRRGAAYQLDTVEAVAASTDTAGYHHTFLLYDAVLQMSSAGNIVFA